MKYLLLLSLLFATAMGAPSELSFLEGLLPHSKLSSTNKIKSTPSGYILADYIGADTPDVVIDRLGKALGVKLVEIPNAKGMDGFFKQLLIGYGTEADSYTRVAHEDITVDILVFHFGQEEFYQRHIYLKISRNGA